MPSHPCSPGYIVFAGAKKREEQQKQRMQTRVKNLTVQVADLKDEVRELKTKLCKRGAS